MLTLGDLAMIAQTFLAGLTVVLWIHGVTPTQEMATDVVKKFLTLAQPPPLRLRLPWVPLALAMFGL